MTTTIKEKTPEALAGTGVTDEMGSNPHPLALNNTTAPRIVNNLHALAQLSDQAAEQGNPLLALELSIERAQLFCFSLREMERSHDRPMA